MTNPDSGITLHDITVEDRIPDGLLVSTGHITVQFGEGSLKLLASSSPRIVFTKSGNQLGFTISSLLPGETAIFSIPAIVNVSEGTLPNTAYITSVNGMERDIPSETTYHKVLPASVSVHKCGLDGEFLENPGGTLPDTLDYEKGVDTGTVAVVAQGEYQFTLAHGETITFKEIPSGATYEVTEADAASSGYTVTSEHATGTIADSDLDISFTNTRNLSIPTGAHSFGWAEMATVALLLLAILYFHSRRKRSRA